MAEGPEPGCAPAAETRVAALVQKADFERLLATRSTSRSTHFALHHLPGVPSVRPRQLSGDGRTELSTTPAPVCPHPVDDFPRRLWLGCVVPKRHARRAVTRNMLKRQVRACFARLARRLPGGLWLVRLRAPFSTTEFVSARSSVLAAAVRAELEALLGQALRMRRGVA